MTLEVGVLTEIDRANAQKLQTFVTGLLTILARAINIVARATFDEAELGSEEDLIALSCTLKPFAQKIFIVAIEAR